MIRVELDATIERPAEEVFDRLTNLEDYSKWMSKSGVFQKSSRTSPGPVRKGTTYRDHGRSGTFVGEISDFEKPTRVAFRETLRWGGLRVMEVCPAYSLQAEDGSTRLHHVHEGQLYGVFKLAQPAVAMIVRRERKRTIDALKKSFGSSPSAN